VEYEVKESGGEKENEKFCVYLSDTVTETYFREESDPKSSLSEVKLVKSERKVESIRLKSRYKTGST
jgi:hypothetical protein